MIAHAELPRRWARLLAWLRNLWAPGPTISPCGPQPGKALYTSVRELVENGLDAAESIGEFPLLEIRMCAQGPVFSLYLVSSTCAQSRAPARAQLHACGWRSACSPLQTDWLSPRLASPFQR